MILVEHILIDKKPVNHYFLRDRYQLPIHSIGDFNYFPEIFYTFQLRHVKQLSFLAKYLYGVRIQQI